VVPNITKTRGKEAYTAIAPLRPRCTQIAVKQVRLAIVILALVALLGAQTAWAAPQASALVHVVRAGDTLYSIARTYGSTVSAIAAANGIVDPNRIYVGQTLIIPGGGAPPGPPPPGGGVYIVRSGDTLYSIARYFGVSLSALIAANHISNPNYIYAGQRLIIPGGGPCYPPCGGTYYTVRPGDTLYSIAWRFGTSVWAIASANGIANPNVIYVGQVLRIP
jgi:LysM repeat protein